MTLIKWGDGIIPTWLEVTNNGIIRGTVIDSYHPPNQDIQKRYEMTAQILTQDRLKELLHYDPSDGVFVWAKRRKSQAGSYSRQGYRRIYINGREYPAHRLAWMYVHGSFPENEIDHINHIKDDNRISNLRKATRGENARNRKLPITNSSGCIGVCLDVRTNKWQAASKHKYYGQFTEWWDAVCARKSIEIEHGYHKNHGSVTT